MLHYRIFGNGTEPLVLIHGFMENSTMWTDMLPLLSPEFTIITIDLPGHGSSNVFQEIHSMEFMAEKVKETLSNLSFSSFHLLGHSMGGYVALAFAEKYPEMLKSLTLFFSTSLADDEEKKQIRLRSIKIIDENFNTFVHSTIPNLFNPNEKEQLEDKINTAKNIALSTPKEGVKAAQIGMSKRPDRTNVLTQLNQKTLILSGKHDMAVKAETFLQTLPKKANIKSYMLDCGHCGHWEKTQQCAEIINQELLN